MNALVGVLHEVLVNGVNHSLPGNGGEECVTYIPHWQKLLESLVFIWLAYQGVKISWTGLGVNNVAMERKKSLSSRGTISQLGDINDDDDDEDDVISVGPKQLHVNELRPMISETYATLKTPLADYIIFNVYFIVFISELLYKIITRTAIFLLNPCHVSTILQLILMKMPKTNTFAMQLFRFHLYMIPGALVAVLFPILNTRLMHGEVLIYYIQHLFILVIPFYLMMTRETFTPEPLLNMSWSIFSVSAFVLYHFVFLQAVALFSRVNLNCILCPALSDPFSGPLWRIFAVAHQSLVIPLITKLYGFVSLRWIALIEGLSSDVHYLDNSNDGKSDAKQE